MAPQLPPVLPSWHPLGHVPRYRRDPLGTIEGLRQTLGDVAALRLGPRGTPLFLFNPRDVEHVLVTRAANYPKHTRGYEKLKLLVGDGLITSEGELWRTQRRLAQPVFRREHIAAFAEIMTSAAGDLLAEWLQSTQGGEAVIDVTEPLGRLALRIAGHSLFGLEVGEEFARLGPALTLALQYVNALVTTPVPWAESWPTAANRRGRGAIRELREIVTRLIAQRRALGPGGDLVSRLLAAQELDETLLRDEAVTSLMAGHETSANALGWTLYLLAGDRGVAAQLEEELDRVLGDRPPQAADQEQLVYTWQVIQEALRLYPPAWMIARSALADDEIAGYRVPAGTYTLLCLYVIQRHPELWPDPTRFDPTRFAPGAEKDRPRFAYFPFGGGQRQCIGDQFARLETTLVLARLVQRLRFARSEQVPSLEPKVTLRPGNGLFLRVSRR